MRWKRSKRGLQRGAAQPTAQFVTTTAAGQLLRAMMTPVRGTAPDDAAMHGFVLMLDNITREFEDESARDQLLHAFTEGSRASLGNLQAAVEMLDDADMDTAMRERFQGVIRDEARAMSRRIQDLAARSTQDLRTRWPLEDMLGADLVSAALRRIELLPGLRAGSGEVDGTLWLKVDSFSLLLALASLAARLADEYDIKRVELRLVPAGPRAHLDLVWTGPSMSSETVLNWEAEPMKVGAESSPLSVRDVVQRHGGEFWFERERVRQQTFFRFLLPLASAQEPLDAAAFVHGDSRPEYYDFDLFQATESTHALDDRPLADLAYTVFDTETTGLNPSQGDEIIQIGATRIVGGKLRRQECFEQLVDPQRNIPAAGIPIHGIRPEMVQRPADHRQRAAGLPHLRAGHGAGGAQRRLRHALPAAQGAAHWRALRAAGAGHAAAVGRRAPEPGVARPGGHRRAPGRQRARPPHRAGRRHGHGRGLPEAAAAAAGRRHLHAGPGARGIAEDLLRESAVLIPSRVQ